MRSSRRMLSVAAVALWTAFGAVSPCAGQSNTASAESEDQRPKSIPELPGPLHCIHLPGNPYVRGAAFSPDGETLYVLINDQAINIWEILVYYWPEIGGGLTAPAGIIFLLALRRILRRPRIVGEPHCRRCNYCLKNAPSPRCPECGTSTKPPIRGRSMRRRIVPFAVPFATLAIAYAIAWAFWLPRSGWFSDWLNWWSYDLETAALRRGVRLAAWKRGVERILAIDVLSGSIHRTLLTRPARLMAPYDDPWLTVTPDGAGLLLPIADGDRLALVGTDSGRVLKTLDYPDVPLTKRSRWTQIAGFDDGGRIIYATLRDDQRCRTKVIRWDLRTDQATLSLEVAADPLGRPANPPTTLAHHVYRVPGSSPRFLEINGVYRSSSEVHLYVSQSGALTPLHFGEPKFLAYPIPSFTSDGTRIVFQPWGDNDFRAYAGHNQLFLYDAETRQSAGELPAPTSHRLELHKCSEPQVGRVVVNAMRRSWRDLLPLADPSPEDFLIADVESVRWIGRCEQPPDWHCGQLFVSSNGEFFAASGFRKHQAELLIYDLRSLPPISELAH